jgi:GMP synthase (glutamine-hydrolysing)
MVNEPVNSDFSLGNMKRILVFQHVPYEPLGTLNPQLKAAGFRIRYVNFSREPQARPSLDGYHGLVVLGGPMSANHGERYPHLLTEIALIREAVESGMPVLGICLGAQLLACALGARVRRSTQPEIGWHEVLLSRDAEADPLMRHLNQAKKIFQWHSDTFDLPRGAIHLAGSDVCANQAFRFGESAYGLQFHLEVDEKLIRRWLNVPAHQHEIQALGGELVPEQILGDTDTHILRNELVARQVFGEFISLFSHHGKRRLLKSR